MRVFPTAWEIYRMLDRKQMQKAYDLAAKALVDQWLSGPSGKNKSIDD